MERIILKKVSKKFKRNSSSKNFLNAILSLEKKKINENEFDVIKEISLNVNSGEIVGIIGDNGSGKSTLLRTISGIYKQNSGNIETNGKIISIINLSSGFQEMLTMKDNIFLLCALFGLSRKEIKKRFNLIVEFSGLTEYVNTRLHKFSNGMLQKVAFSIAVHCNPEILVLDEVFEVGDEEFKKKNVQKIKEIVKEGVSVILVSHDMNLIQKYCNRAILIKEGKIIKEGNSEEVIKEYLG